MSVCVYKCQYEYKFEFRRYYEFIFISMSMGVSLSVVMGIYFEKHCSSLCSLHSTDLIKSDCRLQHHFYLLYCPASQS